MAVPAFGEYSHRVIRFFGRVDSGLSGKPLQIERRQLTNPVAHKSITLCLVPLDRPRPLDRLIAEACSPAPAGRERWTLQLLADRVVQLALADSYSYEAVRRVLKKTNSSRG